MSDLLQSILSSVKCEALDVDEVKHLGLTVRTITGADRAQIVDVQQRDNTALKLDTMIEVALVGIGKADGTRAFEDSQREELKKLPAEMLDRITKQVTRFNKLSRQDVEDAKKN